MLFQGGRAKQPPANTDCLEAKEAAMQVNAAVKSMQVSILGQEIASYPDSRGEGKGEPGINCVRMCIRHMTPTSYVINI